MEFRKENNSYGVNPAYDGKENYSTEPTYDMPKEPSTDNGKQILSKPLALLVLVVGIGVGVLIGYFGIPQSSNDIWEKITVLPDESISQKLMGEISTGNMENYHRDLTEHPHLAGTPADKEQANDLAQFWEDNGIKAVIVPYNVLLSYPDPNNPNRIELQENNGNVLHTTQLVEKILTPEQDQPDVVPPFNAFSAPGNPKGDLIYVNYGRIEDFIWLKEEHNIDFTGKICIARYGAIFRGDKARIADEYGAAGLILYSDPDDYAIDYTDEVYPDSWFLPGTGVQRGNVKTSSGGLGDPLTPGYPAIDSAFRLDESEATGIPRIPVHPIGYDDAYHLLYEMAGEEAPSAWQGKLNFTYKLGPHQNRKVQMHITTSSSRATTHNVIGFIEGSVEPDRYVLLGNHRDAWVYGAIDPTSGSTSMKELSRSFGAMLKEGWRPRRTIVFCSWGAEEYGIIGSREWVENYGHILGDRAVAYLNVDGAVRGNYSALIRALPMMADLLYESTKKVPNPNQEEYNAGRETLYDTWKERYPETVNGNPTGFPEIPILGSGSDFAPFIGKVGVTCSDFRFTHDTTLGLGSYPLYHSVYETYHLYKEHIDPDFLYNRAMAQLWGEVARRLADDYLLPYNVENYGLSIEKYEQSIIDGYGSLMRENGLVSALEYLSQAVQTFKTTSANFMRRLPEDPDSSDPMLIRRLNDQMIQLERKFLNPLGLPDRPLARNVVFAPSAHNSYAGASFPGLVDTMFEIEKLTGAEEDARWKEVAQQLSIVTFYIQNAAASLKDPIHFHDAYVQ